jgi:hypothetical protein
MSRGPALLKTGSNDGGDGSVFPRDDAATL